MTLVPRLRGHRTTYYAVLTWQGRRIWENVGSDAREAKRAEQRLQKMVDDGTFVPKVQRGTTVARFAERWLATRTGRNAAGEEKVFRRFVMSRVWLTSMRLESVQREHALRFIAELKATISETTGKPVSAKYVSNIFGLARTLFRAALDERLIDRDPFDLPRRTLVRRSGRGRRPYDLAAVRKLLSCEEVPLPSRVFASLALLTGMREGEVCGRRWADWDRTSLPLGCLTVDSQYGGAPLKTVREGEYRPRKVPVHPLLAAVLDAWWTRGFELTYCRKPTTQDFLVPIGKAGQGHHTRSSAYKLWRRACELAEVENLSLHSTRHTFITLARRRGSKDVVEQITHNAKGDVVDQYTHWEWERLCEVVQAIAIVDAAVDGAPQSPVLQWRRWESNPGAGTASLGISTDNAGQSGADDPPLRPQLSAGRPPIDARVNDRRFPLGEAVAALYQLLHERGAA